MWRGAVLSLLLTGLALAYRQQTVGVRGRLLCGNASLPDTAVKLWNNNKLGGGAG